MDFQANVTTTAAPPLGVRTRIQANVPQMSEAMTKLATLLLDEPLALLELSITELAARAGTSAATVTRFCRLIGYAGYLPFRVGVAADAGRLRADETWRVDIGRAFDPEDTPEQVLRTLSQSHPAALQATADSIDIDEVVRIAEAIATCGHVDIYGIGGSAVMAREMQLRLYRIGINAHHWGEVHDGLTSAALLDEDSVAIAISNTGRTIETIEMLAQAKSSGAFTLAITSNADSPLAALADVHLVTVAPDEYLQPDDLLGQARPAVRARPALPDRRPAELRADRDDAGRLGRRRRPAPARAERATAGPPRAPHATVPTTRGSRPMTTSTVPAATARRPSRPSASRSPHGCRPSPTTPRAEVSTRPSTSSSTSIRRGGVLQAFGTGHSQAFAMEIAGRAGGFIPTTRWPCATSYCTGPATSRCSPVPRWSGTPASSTSCSRSRRSTPPTCSSSPRTPASTGRSSAWRCGPRPTATR